MEIERKFLLNVESITDIEDLLLLEKKLVEQRYISLNDNEVRIRKSQLMSCDEIIGIQDNTLTIKGNGDLSREEVEIKITEDIYNNLVSSNLTTHRIIKHRYLALYNKVLYEIDEYQEEFKGLKVVEIEFKSEEEASEFVPPNWLGREITYDKKYKNKNLKVRKEYV